MVISPGFVSRAALPPIDTEVVPPALKVRNSIV
jgi:hypothetical protein